MTIKAEGGRRKAEGTRGMGFLAFLLSPSAFLLGALAGAPAAAQDQFLEVPYVPTPEVTVDEMLRLADVTGDQSWRLRAREECARFGQRLGLTTGTLTYVADQIVEKAAP